MEIVSGDLYLREIKELIQEYTGFLNRDLSFQNLSDELEHLERKYLPPYGRLFAALEDGKIAGCVAYHTLPDAVHTPGGPELQDTPGQKHTNSRCEMKRLYVRPEYRKLKSGQKLVETIIQTAREDGFSEMVLDTLKPLESAIGLYKKYGFEETGAYYDNPMDDAVYMRLKL